MADNKTVDNGALSDLEVATDEVTYSGETADVQLVRPVLTTGAEGAKTVVDLPGDASNGLDVDVTRLPAGSLAAAVNTALTWGASDDQTGGNITALAGNVQLWASPSGAGSTWDKIGGDSVNGLDVDVTRLPALPAGTNNIGDVDVLSVPSPLSTAGGGTEATALRVTLASDSTGLVSVDDNAGSLTVDAPVGTPVNVQIGDGTLQASVRNTGANDSLNVAIVDAAGNQITSFGGGSGGTAQADESAFTEGSTSMTPIGGVFNDSIGSDPTEDQAAAVRITAKRGMHANLRKADGTEIASGGGTEANALRVTVANDSTGTLTVDGTVGVSSLPSLPAGSANIGDVDVLSSALPTGAATSANQSTEITALQLIDDPVKVLGTDTYAEATDKGFAIGAVRRDADTTLVNTTNEWGPLQMDANGRLKVEAFSGETLPVSLSTLPALVAGSANIGDVDVLTVPADPFGANADAASATGSMSAKLRFIAATGIPITALPASTNTLEVVGDVAHSIAAAGNPVLNAGVSIDADDTAPPNRVDAESDATRLGVDRDGSLFVRTHGPQLWSYHSNGSTALTDASVHAAPGAGLSLYVTDIIFSSGAATAINAFFEEGASTVLGPFYLEAVAGRGVHIKLTTPKKITANTALTVTTSAAIAHSVDVMGYTAQG